MKAEIFKSYEDFLNRKDKSVNGVSEEFSKNHPDFKDDNAANKGCWNCSRCSGCSDCSYCSGCSDCSRCYGCSGCSRCYGCSRCSRCYGCSRCSGCSDCSYCSGCSDCYEENKNKAPLIPKIENIHSAVYSAACRDGALDMGSWHSCKTTHCRAGWVIHLAGDAGYKAEEFYGVCLAAQLIYRESGYGINPCRFFDDSENAMEDMKKLAEEEAGGQNAGI